jgi:hypothetical protein
MTFFKIILSSLPFSTESFTKFPETNGQRKCNLEFAVTDKETVNAEINADFASNDLKDVTNLRGLVLSRRDPDTLYTVDKSNIRPRVFAIDKTKGTLKSTFLIYDIFSQNFPDVGEWGMWTDLTIAACPGDYQKDCIFILDGGNPFVRRGLSDDETLYGGKPREFPQSIIYFEEPKIISTSIQVAGKRIPFTFPENRAFDVEAITSKDGTIMIVTKNTMDYGDISLDKKINKENITQYNKQKKKASDKKKASEDAKKQEQAKKELKEIEKQTKPLNTTSATTEAPPTDEIDAAEDSEEEEERRLQNIDDLNDDEIDMIALLSNESDDVDEKVLRTDDTDNIDDEEDSENIDDDDLFADDGDFLTNKQTKRAPIDEVFEESDGEDKDGKKKKEKKSTNFS